MRIIQILYYAYLNTENLFRSIFGYNIINNFLTHESSDIKIKNCNFRDLILFIHSIFFINLPFYCPYWLPKNLQLILFGEKSKYIPDKNELDNENNCFLFINGILGNEKHIYNNKKELEKLLNRPINVIYNSSHTLLGDLIESLIGKETENLTEASLTALEIVTNKLMNKNINKVILICYSQGTIITSKVLFMLNKLGINEKNIMKKLEIYCFSNCSSKMNYIINNYPYMEHFANENDFIAKLGCNCPVEIKKLISIDGSIFINKKGNGHLLNLHYLQNFSQNFPFSKLNNYIQ